MGVIIQHLKAYFKAIFVCYGASLIEPLRFEKHRKTSTRNCWSTITNSLLSIRSIPLHSNAAQPQTLNLSLSLLCQNARWNNYGSLQIEPIFDIKVPY